MKQRVWFHDRMVLVTSAFALILAGLFGIYALSNASPAAATSSGGQVAGNAASTYKPQTRNLLVTAVPLLVHEQTGVFDYLKKDFAKGGLLQGTEVWAFSPSTLTVYQGDTVHVTVVNPGGDLHTFTIAAVGFSINVPPLTQRHGSFVVPRAGLYKFYCAIPEHSRYMWGNLVVLPDSDAP
jgi:plastocyanin